MTVTASADSWLARARPNPRARLRLFCFPYAGGGASIFRTWADDLPADVEVCAVQLPGREDRFPEPPFTRLGPLVATLADVLCPYLDRPCAFFGHSMGALIGYQLARRLRKQQQPGPRHLFVAARRAPQLPERHRPIHRLPEPRFLARLRHMGGTPQEVLGNAELMQVMLPTLRADFALTETYVYVPGRALACPISAFGGEQDSEVSPDDLAAWREQTRAAFSLRMMPGNHFFLHSARALLLQSIVQDLVPLLRRIESEDAAAGTLNSPGTHEGTAREGTAREAPAGAGHAREGITPAGDTRDGA